jgi:hypothetical protein
MQLLAARLRKAVGDVRVKSGLHDTNGELFSIEARVIGIGGALIGDQHGVNKNG